MNVTETKWVVYTDGGCRSNPGPGAWAFAVNKESGTARGSGFLPDTTNNLAEYAALNTALAYLLAREPGVLPPQVFIYSDSKLMVNQVNGAWSVSADHLLEPWALAYARVNELRDRTEVFLAHVRRELNTEADRLCNKVMDLHGIVSDKKGVKRQQNNPE
jgi:ribonuclease HI